MAPTEARLPIYSSARPAGWSPDPLPELPGSGDLYIDGEWDGRKQWWQGALPAGWAIHYGDKSHYIPLRHEEGENHDPAKVRDWFRREVRNKRIVNAWTKSDLHILLNDGVDLEEQGCTFHDVMHAEALLDDWLRDFSLEGTAQRRLGMGKLDPGPKDILAQLPPWDVAPYAIRDIELVKGIHQQQQPLLVEQDLERVMALEDRVLPATLAMEHAGCPIDEVLLHQWLEETEERYEREQWQFSREVGFPFNGTNAHLARLFKQCGIANPHRTPTGLEQYRADYVDSVEHPLVQRASGLGKLADLRSKFLVAYREILHNGKLWPTFHQLMVGEEGTISGRYSCVRPNVQQVLNASKFAKFKKRYNLDYNIRRLFIPTPGRPWFSADQAQVEYRLGAHFAYAARLLTWRDRFRYEHTFSDKARAGAERIIEIYRQNPEADFHDTVGDMVRPYRPDLNRTEIKITSFRKQYGGGIQSTADALSISYEAAKELIGQYDEAFPQMKEVLGYAKDMAETRGYVRTLSGRRCRFPNKNERTYKALNGVIQGSAADDFKLAFVTAHEQRKTLGFTPRMVVHDELGGDLEGDPTTLAALLNEQRSNTHVPILWDCGTGANWAEAKG